MQHHPLGSGIIKETFATETRSRPRVRILTRVSFSLSPSLFLLPSFAVSLSSRHSRKASSKVPRRERRHWSTDRQLALYLSNYTELDYSAKRRCPRAELPAERRRDQHFEVERSSFTALYLVSQPRHPCAPLSPVPRSSAVEKLAQGVHLPRHRARATRDGFLRGIGHNANLALSRARAAEKFATALITEIFNVGD